MSNLRVIMRNILATQEASLHDELRQRRRDEWLSRNAAGIQGYNRHVEGHGVFSDAVRGF
jgi:antitoxin CcdA